MGREGGAGSAEGRGPTKPQRAPGWPAGPEVGGLGAGREGPGASAPAPREDTLAARRAPPPRPGALTVLLRRGQVSGGEGQKGLIAHVPVQQARDLAMEAGPEVVVLEFQVHLQREERSPGRGWDTGDTEAEASPHFLKARARIRLVGAGSGVESPQFDAFNRLWPAPAALCDLTLQPLHFRLGAWGS